MNDAMRSRIPLPAADAMTRAQRAVYDSVLSTRPSIQGPFLAWLHRPGLAGPAEQLGAYCRFGSSLSAKESETLILMTAAHLDCPPEWAIHRPIAEREGVDPADIEAIQAAGRPRGGDARGEALSLFVWELLTTNRVCDQTFTAARDTLGVEALVDAAGIVGYYGMVAMTLNAFDMQTGISKDETPMVLAAPAPDGRSC